uniref:protein-serine/threonine phosphatase n=1 Tax=Leersia perrieri TaxID=77586 RepID=A0A0D9V8E1_9ORYZ
MYIYTMGDKAYAIEIEKLLDPDNVYFGSKQHHKGLDVVLGAESVAVILETEHVIKRVRWEVLEGCKLVLTRVFPLHYRPQDQMLWKMAEQLGAVCCTDVDSTVTHVIALDLGTEKARWAVKNNKFLVHPCWIKAANFQWHRQQEDFPVAPPSEKRKENSASSNSKCKENAADAASSKEKGKENAADAASAKERSKENADYDAGAKKGKEIAADAASAKERSKENADDDAGAKKGKEIAADAASAKERSKENADLAANTKEKGKEIADNGVNANEKVHLMLLPAVQLARN